MKRSDDHDRRAGFEALYRAHVDTVRRYCARRAREDMVEDAVAETFTILWRRLDAAPDDPRLWLLGVARRVLANQARAARRRQFLRARLAQQPERLEGPAGEGATEGIVAAVRALGKRDAEALMLVHWDGLSPAEAAIVAGCSPVAMRSRLHRARRRLMAALCEPGIVDTEEEIRCERAG